MVEVLSALRKPLVLDNKSYADVTHDIAEPLGIRTSSAWWAAL